MTNRNKLKKKGSFVYPQFDDHELEEIIEERVPTDEPLVKQRLLDMLQDVDKRNKQKEKIERIQDVNSLPVLYFL